MFRHSGQLEIQASKVTLLYVEAVQNHKINGLIGYKTSTTGQILMKSPMFISKF